MELSRILEEIGRMHLEIVSLTNALKMSQNALDQNLKDNIAKQETKVSNIDRR